MLDSACDLSEWAEWTWMGRTAASIRGRSHGPKQEAVRAEW